MNDYTLEDLNEVLDKLIRTNLRYEKKGSELKEITKWANNFMCVYKITNTINNKIYIGSTCEMTPRRRFTRHLRDLKDGVHFNIHLQRAYDKYGDVFHFEILELLPFEDDYVKSKNKIESIEQKYINDTNCCDWRIGYNESQNVHGGFNNCTWDDIERRAGVKPDILKRYFELLENTDLTFKQIDDKIYEETGFHRKLAYKIYFGYSFRGLARGRNFRERQPRDSIRGELSTKSKLNTEQVKEIINLFVNYPDVSIEAMAKKYNVNRSTIWCIYQKRNWKHLTQDIVFPERPNELKHRLIRTDKKGQIVPDCEQCSKYSECYIRQNFYPDFLKFCQKIDKT